MKLNLSQIRGITTGAARVTEENSAIDFYRFTKEQELLYKKRNSDFYKKTFASSGVKLHFKTDSKTLFIKILTEPGSSRRYFSLDVFVNGRMLGALDNFSNVALPRCYSGVSLPLGEFSGSFSLGKGEKEICIYLPWSVRTEIKELTLDDGSFIKPIRPIAKLLCFGDSITQGYDALRPSQKYTTLLAEHLNAEEFNKGIGSEEFFEELAAPKEDFNPDIITVAYGTNDWNRGSREGFDRNCAGFFRNLCFNYPNAKIFAVTPIWRSNFEESRPFGSFFEVEERIKSLVADFKNVRVISGFELVPHNEEFFGDLKLHPNADGFYRYFSRLCEEAGI